MRCVMLNSLDKQQFYYLPPYTLYTVHVDNNHIHKNSGYNLVKSALPDLKGLIKLSKLVLLQSSCILL